MRLAGQRRPMVLGISFWKLSLQSANSWGPAPIKPYFVAVHILRARCANWYLIQPLKGIVAADRF